MSSLPLQATDRPLLLVVTPLAVMEFSPSHLTVTTEGQKVLIFASIFERICLSCPSFETEQDV